MKILENKKKLQDLLNKIRKDGLKIGLIPTMGSIHQGHLTLIEQSKKAKCYSITSIFINPTQFNSLDDFQNYPQSREEDLNKLDVAKCDIVYFPITKELYPNELKSKRTISNYRGVLCDKFRPGHFDGVTTVVKSLFEHVKPDIAFFGEKDFQQFKIVNKIVEKYKLPIQIKNCPSIRLRNGMSISSRYNNFSLYEEKIFNLASIKIKECVKELRKKMDLNHIKKLKEEMLQIKIKKIDYLEIRDEEKLKLTKEIINARLFVAFYIGKIRVIDNFILY